MASKLSILSLINVQWFKDVWIFYSVVILWKSLQLWTALEFVVWIDISCLKSQTNNPKFPRPGNSWAYWACAVSASIYPSIIVPVYLSVQGTCPLTVTSIQELHLLFGTCQLQHNKDMRKKRGCDWMMNQYSGRRYKKRRASKNKCQKKREIRVLWWRQRMWCSLLRTLNRP